MISQAWNERKKVFATESFWERLNVGKTRARHFLNQWETKTLSPWRHTWDNRWPQNVKFNSLSDHCAEQNNNQASVGISHSRLDYWRLFDVIHGGISSEWFVRKVLENYIHQVT